MPKVILEFDSFEDSEELKVALNGGKWKNVVLELSEYLRNNIKHPSENLTEQGLEELEKINSELYQIIHENQIFLD